MIALRLNHKLANLRRRKIANQPSSGQWLAVRVLALLAERQGKHFTGSELCKTLDVAAHDLYPQLVRLVKTACFEKFPFPVANGSQRLEIAALAEAIDAHRKRQLALHPTLTLTEIYNTLETLRAGRVLTENEKQTNALGLVSTLLELHEQLDALVQLTYGWTGTLSDAQILEKLVTLNLERQGEEAKNTVRYLRPEYQNTNAAQRVSALDLPDDEPMPSAVIAVGAFPKSLGDQSTAIRNILKNSTPLTAVEISKRFKNAPKKRVMELLELLESLGQISKLENETFQA